MSEPSLLPPTAAPHTSHLCSPEVRFPVGWSGRPPEPLNASPAHRTSAPPLPASYLGRCRVWRTQLRPSPQLAPSPVTPHQRNFSRSLEAQGPEWAAGRRAACPGARQTCAAAPPSSVFRIAGQPAGWEGRGVRTVNHTLVPPLPPQQSPPSTAAQPVPLAAQFKGWREHAFNSCPPESPRP